MPPSPIIKPMLNQIAWAKLLAELDLGGDNEPTVKFRLGRIGEYAGSCRYGKPSQITMWFGLESIETHKLTAAMAECSRTLIHEARHAWQHANGFQFDPDTVAYELRKQEVDAEDFAYKRCHEYKTLVKLVRSFPSSPMSRLDKTQRNVRRVV